MNIIRFQTMGGQMSSMELCGGIPCWKVLKSKARHIKYSSLALFELDISLQSCLKHLMARRWFIGMPSYVRNIPSPRGVSNLVTNLQVDFFNINGREVLSHATITSCHILESPLLIYTRNNQGVGQGVDHFCSY